MDIFLENIKLERVNFGDDEKVNYIEKLVEDEEIKKYLGYLQNGVFISRCDGYLNSHYVVKVDSNYVGYLYLSPPFIKDNKTNSEIRYAIDSMYRECGIANTLVKNVTELLLGEEIVDTMVAVIQKDNHVSKHIIENNGYIQTDEDLDGIIFEKSR